MNLDPDRPLSFNNVNYSDDFGGCESSLHKATASYQALATLFAKHGLSESVDKACAPATSLVFLGVHFNSVKMTMSVPQEKLQELRSDLEIWGRKTILFVVVKLVITGVGNPDSGYWIPCGGGNMLVT